MTIYLEGSPQTSRQSPNSLPWHTRFSGPAACNFRSSSAPHTPCSSHITWLAAPWRLHWLCTYCPRCLDVPFSPLLLASSYGETRVSHQFLGEPSSVFPSGRRHLSSDTYVISTAVLIIPHSTCRLGCFPCQIVSSLRAESCLTSDSPQPNAVLGQGRGHIFVE